MLLARGMEKLIPRKWHTNKNQNTAGHIHRTITPKTLGAEEEKEYICNCRVYSSEPSVQHFFLKFYLTICTCARSFATQL